MLFRELLPAWGREALLDADHVDLDFPGRVFRPEVRGKGLGHGGPLSTYESKRLRGGRGRCGRVTTGASLRGHGDPWMFPPKLTSSAAGQRGGPENRVNRYLGTIRSVDKPTMACLCASGHRLRCSMQCVLSGACIDAARKPGDASVAWCIDACLLSASGIDVKQ